MFYIQVASVVTTTYYILVTLGTMPKDHAKQQSPLVYTHVVVVRFIGDMLVEFDGTINFAILLARTDKRVSAVHITIFAAMSNMCSFIHKLYIFRIIDAFGIFVP